MKFLILKDEERWQSPRCERGEQKEEQVFKRNLWPFWVALPEHPLLFRSASGREEQTVRSEAGSGEEMDEDEYETIDKVGGEKSVN